MVQIPLVQTEIRTKIARNSIVVPFCTNLHQTWSKIADVGADLCKICPKLHRFRPKLSKIREISIEIRQIMLEIAEHCSTRSAKGPTTVLTDRRSTSEGSHTWQKCRNSTKIDKIRQKIAPTVLRNRFASIFAFPDATRRPF